MTFSAPLFPSLQPFQNFHFAAGAALKFLQDHLGFDLCMISRVKDGQWIVVNVEDRRYGITAGAAFPWKDTLCHAMLSEKGSSQQGANQQVASVIPDISKIEALTAVPFATRFNVAAYVSLPLFHRDGTLFGTLCGFHPEAKPAGIEAQQPLLELLVQLLLSLLDSDLRQLQQKRQIERQQMDCWRDELTGLYNRQAWQHFLSVEDSRCHRYGRDACVISLQLDLQVAASAYGANPAETWIKAIAQLLRSILREEDIIARVEADRLGIVAVETEPERLSRLANRIREQLRIAAFPICFGSATRDPSATLAAAWQQAQASEQAMALLKA